MFYKAKKGQSILEYGILLGVIIAAVLIMQVFIKRHFSGGLKESAERMGSEMFSASDTTIHQSTTLIEDQRVTEESGTTAAITPFLPQGMQTIGTVERGAYSFAERTGRTESDERKRTSAATREGFRWDDYDTTLVDNFESNNLNFD